MTTLYVAEYANIYERSLVPIEPALNEQTVSIGASSTASASFTDSTRFVVLSSDSICSIKFGPVVAGVSPTATASNLRLPANTLIVFGVPPGQQYQVATITNT